MLHKLMLTAIVLAAGALGQSEGISAAQWTARQVLPRPQARGYWVQFRQPEWREQSFTSQAEMDQFIRSQQQNGWEVEVSSLPDGESSVRYRLLRWGGSRIVDTIGEAREWAAQLAAQGYQTRIVDYP